MLYIGEVIKTKRKENGLTQEELASMLGVTKAAVSKWENAESYPDITLLTTIADQFRITMDELFGYNPAGLPRIVNCYKTLFYLSNIQDRSVLDHGKITECRLQKYGIKKDGEEIEYHWEVLVKMRSEEEDILTTFQKCMKPGCYIDFVSKRTVDGKFLQDGKPNKHYVCKEKIWEYNLEENLSVNGEISKNIEKELLAMGLIKEEDICD